MHLHAKIPTSWGTWVKGDEVALVAVIAVFPPHWYQQKESDLP